MKVYTTDVVVVGGGAAGCYAALELKKKRLDAVIVCKGFVGKSGASLFAGNLVLGGGLLGNTQEQARNTAEFLIKYHNQYLIDQTWAKRCGEWIERVYYPELEEAGLYFRRDAEGNVVVSPGKIRSIAANVQGNSGVPFMDLRRKQVLKAGIRRLEETIVTKLLRDDDGNVCGVFTVNCMTGEYAVVLARAVVLATGYSDRLHKRSTGTREMAGDGLAMAWRVGASLVNLEMQWWHTNDVAHPPAWQRVQIYPNPVLASQHSARMVNSRGEEFFNQQIDDPMAFGPYTVQLKRLVEQVRAGKARYDGGYYAGFDHVDPKEIDAYTTYNKPFYQLGLDPKKGPIETAVTAHYRQGGILVDTTKMRSTVPGLYIAGGVGGHSNGLIALVTFDGKCVADGVAEDIDEIKHPLLPEQEVAIERRRLDALLSSNGTGEAPAKVKEAIRNVMWDKVGVEKNHAGLISALKDLDRIRTMDVPHMRLKNKARVANYEWVDAMDVHNMIDVAELVVHASIERQESRGPFIRTDFPETDNEKWLAANIMIKTDNGFSFKQVPYETPFFAPEFARRDNMSVPW